MEEIKKEPITVLFILLNILIFLVVDFTGGSENTAHMIECGAAYPPLILENGEIYRLFTCMFLHFGVQHLLYNMLLLIFVGDMLEKAVGKMCYLMIYLGGGILGNLLSMGVAMKTGSYAVSVGVRRDLCSSWCVSFSGCEEPESDQEGGEQTADDHGGSVTDRRIHPDGNGQYGPSGRLPWGDGSVSVADSHMW